jgi:hypothetical protein
MKDELPIGRQIRAIDNRRLWMPFTTTLLVVFLAWVLIWFFRGGSFRLYASAFFGLYYLTGQIWVSVLLIGISQNIIFLPLRFIGMKLSQSFKDFEEKLDKTKENEQYFAFTEKVKKGDSMVVFYIFNFVVNAIAFFSAGRIFLIDFYTQKLNPAYLYKFIPYPQYPLVGTDFHFPFFKITETMALKWSTIFWIWMGVTIFFAVLKLLWRIVRGLLSKNQKLLGVRINYNRLMLTVGEVGVTLLVVSIIILRNIPIEFDAWPLVADLTRQNTTMNTITAIATFLTTIHAGYTRQRIDAEIAKRRGVSADVIYKVLKEKMKVSFKNAVILGLGAFFITNQIPCAFELSVATFEFLYILAPYTFDKLLIRAGAGGWADQKTEAIETNEG